jgi:hypothetical protein
VALKIVHESLKVILSSELSTEDLGDTCMIFHALGCLLIPKVNRTVSSLNYNVLSYVLCYLYCCFNVVIKICCL